MACRPRRAGHVAETSDACSRTRLLGPKLLRPEPKGDSLLGSAGKFTYTPSVADVAQAKVVGVETCP